MIQKQRKTQKYIHKHHVQNSSDFTPSGIIHPYPNQTKQCAARRFPISPTPQLFVMGKGQMTKTHVKLITSLKSVNKIKLVACNTKSMQRGYVDGLNNNQDGDLEPKKRAGREFKTCNLSLKANNMQLLDKF